MSSMGRVRELHPRTDGKQVSTAWSPRASCLLPAIGQARIYWFGALIRKNRVKRILACVALVLLSAICFWVAGSAINAALPPAHKGRAANPAGAESTGGGAASGSATNSPAADSGSNSSASGGAPSSPTTNAASGILSCQTKCQAGSALCQSDCFQKYNVTNQTQYWNRCMQSCGTNLSVCSNNCISGVSLPPISSVLPPLPPPPPVQPPARSPPPLAPQQDESSSSSHSQ
jgi:hypothetical protein